MSIWLRFLFSCLCLFAADLVVAAPILSIPKLGEHHRIFTYEKSENNQNIMVAFTQLEPNCQIRRLKGKPVFDFYWLMNREKYKPVAALIKRKIRQRLQLENSNNSDSFQVILKDISELNPELENRSLTVRASKDLKGQCQVQATLPSEPGSSEPLLVLNRIFTQVEKTWNPLDRKIISIQLSGLNEKTGAPISRAIKSKRK